MSDQENKDRVIEELRRDKEVLRRGLDDKDRAARLEELRFAKKQQWYIATSAVTLLAAIFGIAHVIKPNLYEKIAATVLVALIMGFACWFLCKLQGHLKRTRTLLDPMEPQAMVSRCGYSRSASGDCHRQRTASFLLFVACRSGTADAGACQDIGAAAGSYCSTQGAGGETRGRRRLGQGEVAMTTRTHFTFRIDTWTPDGQVNKVPPFSRPA